MFLFQYTNTSVYPTQLRFEVTVDHAGSSTDDAYSVSVTGGDSGFDILWSDRTGSDGPATTDPDLTVTNDRLWEYTADPLGKEPIDNLGVGKSGQVKCNELL